MTSLFSLFHSGSSLHCINSFILKLPPNEELGFQADKVILKSLKKKTRQKTTTEPTNEQQK